MNEILISILVICSIILIWYVYFNYMTRNIDARIIARGDGYVIQIKGKIKWNDIKNSDNEVILFKSKEDAGEVLTMAKQYANKR